MRIIFLGTGPSKRIPRPDCGKWYVCREARKPGSKSARLQRSAFFEFENQNILMAVKIVQKQNKNIFLAYDGLQIRPFN